MMSGCCGDEGSDCMICGEGFSVVASKERRPRVLVCGHFFCGRCLGEMLANSGMDQSIVCPLDRTVTGPLTDVHKNLPLHLPLIQALAVAQQQQGQDDRGPIPSDSSHGGGSNNEQSYECEECDNHKNDGTTTTNNNNDGGAESEGQGHEGGHLSTHHCVECGVNICEVVVRSHQLRGHTITTVLRPPRQAHEQQQQQRTANGTARTRTTPALPATTTTMMGTS
eukprot:c20653_g1_i4.p1 GENE.c20653_g1_i4~~c20653_g1_i4.p1  ORF type:complete len:224 (+),score=37.07 c20653_g1_i4:42-713(+)